MDKRKENPEEVNEQAQDVLVRDDDDRGFNGFGGLTNDKGNSVRTSVGQLWRWLAVLAVVLAGVAAALLIGG